MKRLIFALIAALILTVAPSAHAAPKGGGGAEPAQKRQAPEALSIERDGIQFVPCGRNHYPHLYDDSAAPAPAHAAGLSAGEVTAIVLGALAVLATALVLIASGTRRPRRGRTPATASGS